MTFAFCFLTYDNFTHPEIIWDFTKTENIYIHPKYPEQVIEKFKPYIIDNLIDTEWGHTSIVNATLNLLKTAYFNTNNTWFILLSQDSYPIYTYNTFVSKFNKVKDGNKSMFHLYNDPPLTGKDEFTKTSQWWILHRDDVELILNNNTKYEKRFSLKFGVNSKTAFDEYYFLTLLKWINPKYEFVNMAVMYVDFLQGTIQKSPKIFNKLIQSDIDNIAISESFFIRKVSPVFTMKLYTPQKKLNVIYIGTETNQNKLSLALKDDTDIIIISAIEAGLIRPYIFKKSICVIQIIYKFFYETIIALNNSGYTDSWESVLFTTEKFDLSEPYKKTDSIKRELPYTSTPSTGKIAFLFLVLDNPHFPRVWDTYFAGNETRSSIYIHPKYPDRTSWHRDRVISELHETGWGYIVSAYLALFKTALADPENVKFIIVSESCLPVKSFGEMYGRLTANKDESFVKQMPVKRYDTETRITPQIKKMLRPGQLIKHYARMCLSRQHVVQLLHKDNVPLLRLFTQMHVGDEFFLSVISPIKNNTPIAVVFDDWEFVETQKIAIKAHIRTLYEEQEASGVNRTTDIATQQRLYDEVAKSPKTITHVSSTDLSTMASTSSFFYRKFAKDSDVENHIYPLIAPPKQLYYYVRDSFGELAFYKVISVIDDNNNININYTSGMKVIHNFDEAYTIGKECIEKMNTKEMKTVEEIETMKHLDRKLLPNQVLDETWQMSLPALSNTLKYVFEHLHHSCYLLCVESNIPTMYKLENRTTTAPIFSKVLENATDKRKGTIWNNPTITQRQKQEVFNYVKKPVRVMQCVVKEYQKKENNIPQNEYITFFENEMKKYGIRIPDGVYLFNLTDAIILREDGTEPFQMVTGNKPLGKYNFKYHIPIFSMSGQRGYKDIPMPNYDDIHLIRTGYHIYPWAYYNTDWKEKKYNKAVFRGGPTGCGYTSATNMRLKLVEMSYNDSKFYDDVDAEIITKNKYNINSSSIRFDPKYGIGMLNSNIKPGKPMDMEAQSNYKYIIHIDGNVNAYRLLNTMFTGSLILRVDSEYTSWLDHLITNQCFVRIKSDLSNIREVIQWCRDNDEACSQIANNALRFAQSVAYTPKYSVLEDDNYGDGFVSRYMMKLLNIVSPVLFEPKSPHFSPPPLVSPHGNSPQSPDSPSPHSPIQHSPIQLPTNRYIPNKPNWKDWDSPPYTVNEKEKSPDSFILPTPPNIIRSVTNEPISPPFIPSLQSNISSILPEGLFNKTGKKCPNGSKTHKYKNKVVCKKNNISVKQKTLSPVIVLEQQESPLPYGLFNKTGKKCPNGSKTHKYKNKDVCKKNNISVKQKTLSPVIVLEQQESPLPYGLFNKTGKKCPNGSKTYKYKNKDLCKKNI